MTEKAQLVPLDEMLQSCPFTFTVVIVGNGMFGTNYKKYDIKYFITKTNHPREDNFKIIKVNKIGGSIKLRS